MALKESFEWAPPGIKEIPKGNLLKLIAKTEATTYHPTDPDYPVRKFNTEELKRAARTLIGRPVGRNHEAMPIYGAYVLDSEFSEKENRVESIVYTPPSWVDKVRKGLINRCSIEYTWRGEHRNGGVEFEGLVFTRVDLLEGLNPGDKNSAVTLFEADGESKTGALLTEVVAVETTPAALPPPVFALGEPFAGYADFDACVAANQDKADPNAYCGYIKHQIEAEAKIAAEVAKTAAETAKINVLTDKIKPLEEAVLRISTELQTIKSTQDERIKAAGTFAHEELKQAVESVMPKGGFIKDQKLNMLIRDIKEVLDEPIHSH